MPHRSISGSGERCSSPRAAVSLAEHRRTTSRTLNRFPGPRPLTIPERDDQIAHRRKKPGRPIDFGVQQRARYRDRNVVERCFNKLKQWRGIAMRSNKLARNHHARLCLAATLYWIVLAIEDFVTSTPRIGSDLLTFDRPSIDNRYIDHDLPRPSFALVIATQSLLGALFFVGIGVIALLPGLSASVAVNLPEYAELCAPLLALAIAVTVLGLVSLAMVALLVHRIHRGTVLTRSSLLWVDVIVTTLVCAVVLVITGFVVISNGQAGSPFLALTQAMACLTLMALACITLVLRSLLRHAILIRTELDEVV